MAISQHPPQARIPLELFREIISHIEDTSILATLALVCHVLLHEARRQLYTSVAPQDTSNVLQHLHLLRTLVERPTIASLVTSFRSSEVIQVYERPIWDLLHGALRQMSNLKRLHFRSFGGAPCGDLLLDCPFQLEYLHWGNHSETLDIDSAFCVALSQQLELRYLHLECDPPGPGAPGLPAAICPRLEILEGNFASLETFLPGRNVTAISWIPELRESTSIQPKLRELAAEFLSVRMLTFGGYFARPHLNDIIEYIPAVEYLELVGYALDELELLSQLTNLRRLVLTLGRPSSSGALPPSGPSSSSFAVSTRFSSMQRLLQQCNSLERIDLMHNRSFTHSGSRNRKATDDVFYEKFELSSPGSSVFTVVSKRRSFVHDSQFVNQTQNFDY